MKTIRLGRRASELARRLKRRSNRPAPVVVEDSHKSQPVDPEKKAREAFLKHKRWSREDILAKANAFVHTGRTLYGRNIQEAVFIVRQHNAMDALTLREAGFNPKRRKK